MQQEQGQGCSCPSYWYDTRFRQGGLHVKTDQGPVPARSILMHIHPSGEDCRFAPRQTMLKTARGSINTNRRPTKCHCLLHSGRPQRCKGLLFPCSIGLRSLKIGTSKVTFTWTSLDLVSSCKSLGKCRLSNAYQVELPSKPQNSTNRQ